MVIQIKQSNKMGDVEVSFSRKRMFYESNESMSHKSMSQQVGSAVFYKDRTC